MQPIEGVFEGVARVLEPLGYHSVEDVRHSEAFGSRYAVFSGDDAKQRLRLIWDGKDEWFILQGSGTGTWEDLSVERTGPGFEVTDVVEALSRSIAQQVKERLDY